MCVIGNRHCIVLFKEAPQRDIERDSEPASFTTARFLLKPGRTYEQAVKAFQPYMEIKDPYPEGRDAIVYLLRQATTNTSRRYYPSVNNRFEGSTPWTIVNALASIARTAN